MTILYLALLMESHIRLCIKLLPELIQTRLCEFCQTFLVDDENKLHTLVVIWIYKRCPGEVTLGGI